MRSYIAIFSAILLALFIHTPLAHAEATEEEMNLSNNPLTPMAGLVLQDYIISSFYDTDSTANSFLLRGTLPMKIGGYPQLARMTLPYNTNPGPNGDNVSGFGDINIFDIFLTGSPTLQFGVGPYLIFPTASKEVTGAGKWQVGAAGTIMAPQQWGLLGALVTYQHDFAGDSDRPTQNIFTLQPFIIYNLPHSFYLRSVGIWNFDWETGNYYIPIGFGVGKVWKLENGVVMNAYAEPQWTVAHEGLAQPEFQTLVGLNFQFPLGL